MSTPHKELAEDLLFTRLIHICLILKIKQLYKTTEDINKDIGNNDKSESEIRCT